CRDALWRVSTGFGRRTRESPWAVRAKPYSIQTPSVDLAHGPAGACCARRALARCRLRPAAADDPRRALVRDDGRAALRAARDLDRARAFASATRPRRTGPERRPALPAPDRAALRGSSRPRRAQRGPLPERVPDQLGVRPGLPPRQARHRPGAGGVVRRRRDPVRT